MSPRFTKKTLRTLVCPDLSIAYTDFILSRQAMQCTSSTLEFYRYTAYQFLFWIEEQHITTPKEITARHVRLYLAQLANTGKKDTTLHAHARAIRSLVRFWYAEGYTDSIIKYEMPRLEKKRLPILTADQLRQVLGSCNTRDKAILLFMVDSGLRRGEICKLNWGDVNVENGLVRVKQGKGKKDRSAVVGATTRRALLKYRKTIRSFDETALFLSRTNQRLTGTGLLIIFRRLSKQTGIHITPHAMRRTFVVLSLRAGMDAGHIQAMLGHTKIDMVYRYAQLAEDDLLWAHKGHGPIDNLF